MTMSSGKKPRLPEGWKVQQSKTYPDHLYYYNVLSGDVTWEMPILGKTPKELKPEGKINSEIKKIKKDDVQVKRSRSRTSGSSTSPASSFSSPPAPSSSRSSSTLRSSCTSSESDSSGKNSGKNSVGGCMKTWVKKSNQRVEQKPRTPVKRTNLEDNEQKPRISAKRSNLEDNARTSPPSGGKLWLPPRQKYKSPPGMVLASQSVSAPRSRSRSRSMSRSRSPLRPKGKNRREVSKDKTTEKSSLDLLSQSTSEHETSFSDPEKSHKITGFRKKRIAQRSDCNNLNKPQSISPDSRFGTFPNNITLITKKSPVIKFNINRKFSRNIEKRQDQTDGTKIVAVALTEEDDVLDLTDDISQKAADLPKVTVKAAPIVNSSPYKYIDNEFNEMWRTSSESISDYESKLWAEPPIKVPATAPVTLTSPSDTSKSSNKPAEQIPDVLQIDSSDYFSEFDILEAKRIREITPMDHTENIDNVWASKNKLSDSIDYQTDLDIESMDCSWGEQDSDQVTIIIVCDTNVLLSELDIVIHFRDTEVIGYGKPVLLLPWACMQELDSIKDSERKLQSKTSGLTIDQARKAISWINNSLSVRHVRVRGQSADDDAKKLGSTNLEEEMTDDRILKCCLQTHEKYPQAIVILFTLDTNLRNKAMINGVKVANKEDLGEELEYLSKTPRPAIASSRSTSPVETISSKTKSDLCYFSSPLSYVSNVTDVNDSGMLNVRKKDAHEQRLCDEMICRVKEHLLNVFKLFIEDELKKEFGDLWKDVAKRKPPWTAVDILLLLDGHWIGLFGDMFGRNLVQCVKSSREKLKPISKLSYTLMQVYPLLEDVLLLMKGALQKIPTAKAPIDELGKLVHVCKRLMNKDLPFTSDLQTLLAKQPQPITISPLKDQHRLGSIKRSNEIYNHRRQNPYQKPRDISRESGNYSRNDTLHNTPNLNLSRFQHSPPLLHQEITFCDDQWTNNNEAKNIINNSSSYRNGVDNLCNQWVKQVPLPIHEPELHVSKSSSPNSNFHDPLNSIEVKERVYGRLGTIWNGLIQKTNEIVSVCSDVTVLRCPQSQPRCFLNAVNKMAELYRSVLQMPYLNELEVFHLARSIENLADCFCVKNDTYKMSGDDLILFYLDPARRVELVNGLEQLKERVISKLLRVLNLPS